MAEEKGPPPGGNGRRTKKPHRPNVTSNRYPCQGRGPRGLPSRWGWPRCGGRFARAEVRYGEAHP